MTDIREAFNSLSEVAHDINNSSDYLNEVVDRIQEKLNELNLGISVWYEEGTELDIGYTKLDGKWGLVIGSIKSENESKTEYHFKDAPREARIEAIILLPGLIEKIYAEAEKLEARINNAAVEANNILKKMI
jgi:hypothetical protein